jgi:phosphoglycolate phosphatase
MPRTRAVLLDLDGTLVDSQSGIVASSVAALRALGHDPGEALDIRRAIGPPLEDMMQALLQTRGDDRIDQAVAAYRQHYSETGLLGSEPYPGIGTALEEMRQTGLRIFLATSKREVFATRILENLWCTNDGARPRRFSSYASIAAGPCPNENIRYGPRLASN